ncbi:hypothetical protein DYB37_006289 [Aphanomyces astaci]|uniref:Myb-like domain-containing protein n=1 Tax=Aphanomyces astaci TaxID=112090 RepID=A0A3R7BKM1_APHAT|nr:hypothetical protein DYB35_012172 [Aphanomyces astaci]RHZ17869.1 hypothetical protein DYB37_006289 [Aphanomyces astaci]
MKYFSTQAMLLKPTSCTPQIATTSTGVWTVIEHTRFLAAIDLFPQGPWKAIAKDIGTRTPRQTQTHVQKYCEKLFRQSKTPKLPTRKIKSAIGDVSKVKTHVALLEAILPACVPSNTLSMNDAMDFLVELVVDSSDWDIFDTLVADGTTA